MVLRKHSVDTKHLASMKILTDLKYLPDLTVYEKLEYCRSNRYHLLYFMELHAGSGSIACGCLTLFLSSVYSLYLIACLSFLCSKIPAMIDGLIDVTISHNVSSLINLYYLLNFFYQNPLSFHM